MHSRTFAGVALAMSVAGCATFSPDGGLDEVRTIAQQHIGAPAHALGGARSGVEALVREPLTADTAVQIALLNSPSLQAHLAELGIAEADLVQAGTLRNPVLAYSNRRNADVVQIERSVLVNVAALLTMPLAIEIEQRRFSQAKLAAASGVVLMAATTRAAFFRAVAAQEMVAYYSQVKVAAEAGRDLARRMAEAGNFTKVAQMREELFYADASTQLARAQLSAINERERLTRLLGINDPALLKLPLTLPDLPAAPIALPNAEQAAMDARLDVRMGVLETEGVAQALGLTKVTRVVNVLDAGYVNESETGDARKNGYEIVLELPIFDWGSARVARAEARYKQAMARAAETAVNARSEVRAGYAAYRTSYDVAKHYRDDVVPLRKRIAEETVLRYNAMLIGVFELLADAREQVGSVTTAIEATRDFWLADTALQLALAGKAGEASSPASSGQTPSSPATHQAH